MPGLIRERLERVEERIGRAAARAGRRRGDVILIAVTKMFPAPVVREGFAAGLRDFGENYVQEFEGKRAELTDIEGARFHLIGHLQSNKARRASELFDCVQTVDSERLARRLGETGRRLQVMIEVNLAGEESKSGVAPGGLEALIDAVRAQENLRLTGLMTIPPWSEDPETSRPYFSQLSELALRHGLSALSMGMSHDFEAAIEEGATHIRVGSALFGPRPRRL